jgi:hypothetical protein
MILFRSVDNAPLPDGALLQEFVVLGEYTDSFVVRVGSDVTFPTYVESFYTSGRKMKWTYRCLLGFHRLYSRALLLAAARQLGKQRPSSS